MPEYGQGGLGPTASELDAMATSAVAKPDARVKMVQLNPEQAHNQLDYRCIGAEKVRPSSVLKSKDRALLHLENELIVALATGEKASARNAASELKAYVSGMIKPKEDSSAKDTASTISAYMVARKMVDDWLDSQRLDKMRGYSPKASVGASPRR